MTTQTMAQPRTIAAPVRYNGHFACPRCRTRLLHSVSAQSPRVRRRATLDYHARCDKSHRTKKGTAWAGKKLREIVE